MIFTGCGGEQSSGILVQCFGPGIDSRVHQLDAQRRPDPFRRREIRIPAAARPAHQSDPGGRQRHLSVFRPRCH